MKKLRKITALILMISVIATMVSCKGKSKSTLSVWVTDIFSTSEDNPFDKEINTILDENKGSNIELKIMKKEEMEKAIEEGSKPDILIANPELISEFSEKLDYMDIKTSEKSDKKEEKESETTSYELSDELKNVSKLGGETEKFAPLTYSPYLMGFNKTILEDLGMLDKLPKERTWTPDEYKNFMLELRKAISGNKQYFNSVDTGIFYYGSSAGDVGTKSMILNIANLDKTNDINSEAGINALKFMQTLMKDNAFGKNKISLAEDLQQNDILVNGYSTTAKEVLDSYMEGGQAHIIFYSPEYDMSTASEKDFDTIFMPYPSNEKSKHQYSVCGAVGINSDDKEKNGAIENTISLFSAHPEVFAKNSGMLSVSQNQSHLPYSDDEKVFLATMSDKLAPYRSIGYEKEEEKVEWMILLRRVLFDGEEPSKSFTPPETKE